MIGFVLNPPRFRRKAGVHRPLRKRRRKSSRSAMAWKREVQKYGIMGAAARRRRGAKRTRRTMRRTTRRTMRRSRRKLSLPKGGKFTMARRRKLARKSRRRVRRARRSRRIVRRRKMAANPPVRRRRRRYSRRRVRHNAPELNPRRRSRRRVRRVRRARRVRHTRRRYRKNSWPGQPVRHRRAARKAWRRHRRTMLPAVRRNIRKALNRKFGMRKWTKHSRAKWNPGVALSLKGVGQSITSVFRIENVYDGLAIGGGIVGALALPRVIERLLPASWTNVLPFSITTGWGSYVASAVSAGLLGYGAGAAFGRRVGEKVFLGGIGATIAKLLLDKIPMFASTTGVTLGAYGDYNLSKMIEQEVVRELHGGSAMNSYVSPEQIARAYSLNDYAQPSDMLSARALGDTQEFNEAEDFES